MWYFPQFLWVGNWGTAQLEALAQNLSWTCSPVWAGAAPEHDWIYKIHIQSGSLTRVARWCWRLARGLFLSSGPFCRPSWVSWRYSSWLPPEWTIQETKLTGRCLLRPSVGPNQHFYSILLLTQAALVQCGRAYTKAWVPGGVAHWGHVGCCYHQYSSSQMLQAKLSAHQHRQAAGDPPSSNLCIFEWNYE